MSIFLLIIIVIVLLIIAIYGVQQIPQAAPFQGLLIFLFCMLAIGVIANRAGLL